MQIGKHRAAHTTLFFKNQIGFFVPSSRSSKNVCGWTMDERQTFIIFTKYNIHKKGVKEHTEFICIIFFIKSENRKICKRNGKAYKSLTFFFF